MILFCCNLVLKFCVQDPCVTGQGRQLPAVPQGLGDQGSGLTSLELRHMGRDTIAGLIAGILQKYTKREVSETSSHHRRHKCPGQFMTVVYLFRPLSKR